MTDLAPLYRAYIDCLNRRDWARLGDFVDDRARHNGRPFGLAGYRAMLEQDVREIPDLRFVIGLLACDPPLVAARLDFTCTPRGRYFGLDIDGRTVSFSENVFYRFRGGRIVEVWSLIDREAIAAQL
ncbi:ester cyclase [Inquilinus sp.]|jgi:predicted ester cyclase|uniref:ester cyclase n=1 Tax=Inquilinus sp. TaxID=1932117 RepID=UPI0037834A89